MAYLDTINRVWDNVRISMRDLMNDTAVDLWFGGLSVTAFDGNTIVFDTDEEMKVNIINEKYRSEIERRFSEYLGFPVTVELHFTGTPVSGASIARVLRGSAEKEKPFTTNEKTEIGSTIPPFNFDYTFDNFIVGSSNKFAHAACVAVADRPAMDFNPLFIYGPSGIGKTHLLYAITNEMKKKKHDISVIYIKGEDFTNQMIDSLSRQAMKEFRDRYRLCDVLMIDDIQFIAGKVATQEEFFHTFNALFEDSKQIILTSDRPPREIKTLEDRLKTRFEWGLIADIQPPDLELRVAIIKKKADQAHIEIPEDVLYYLAENLRSNIRQLEGAIRKMSARHYINGEEVGMEMAHSCITELLGGAEPVSTTVEKIFAAVYRKYGIKKEELVGIKRNKDIAQARHITIYLIRDITEMSLPNIGKIFDRDHTTIMASIDTVNKKMNATPSFRLDIDAIIKEIKES